MTDLEVPTTSERNGDAPSRVVRVKVSEADWCALRHHADAAGVTVPRLLVDAALSGHRYTVRERRAMVAALLSARCAVAGAATNLLELARIAGSTGQIPFDVAGAVRRMDEATDAMTAAAARVVARRPADATTEGLQATPGG